MVYVNWPYGLLLIGLRTGAIIPIQVTNVVHIFIKMWIKMLMIIKYEKYLTERVCLIRPTG